MIYTEDEIKDLLKEHSEKSDKWVVKAREKSKTLKALVNGDGFHEELINRIEHLESEERAIIRGKYSKDIRDLFSRVMKKRQNVFDANGGSENDEITSDTIKDEFFERLSHFKANKSLYNYLSETYFQLTDIDPNGVILLEYEQINDEFNLYPTYKSIDDIRYYKSNGQLLDYIVFEPKVHEETQVKSWRIIDDINDYTFTEVQGNFILNEDKTFEHPFGKVPGVILSNTCKTGDEIRYSPIHDITELSKDYARDKSILTIYKFQNGIPIHYRYGSKCKTCSGTGKTGNNSCSTCDGKGYPKKADVSDMHIIPIPKDGQPVLGDKIAGFTSPDLDTWKQYKEDLRDMEVLIDDTIWGTDKTHYSKHSNETATGRYIDLQPVTNTLNKYSDVVEYVYNTFANWTLNFVDRTKNPEEKIYNRSFGRNYIIESPEVLAERYGEAKKKGDNNTILDKMLEEWILSKYKSDPFMQTQMIKKAKVEPYVHLSTEQVNNFFGKVEANKKVLFHDFWEECNKDLTYKELKKQFNIYFNTNNTITNESSTKEKTLE